MIRFRLGQGETKGGTSQAIDAFSMVVDGVNLLPEASAEPLGQVVGSLLKAVAAMAVDRADATQFSLPDARLEVVLLREHDELELAVVSLGRPARVARGPIRVEFSAFVAATATCARQLATELAQPRRTSGLRRALQRDLDRLGSLVHAPRHPSVQGVGSSYRSAPSRPAAFSFEWHDPSGVVSKFSRRCAWPLPSLLARGSVALAVGPHRWQVDGYPFLIAVELARQAQDLAQSLDLRERYDVALAGSGPHLRLDGDEPRLRLGDHDIGISPRLLVAEMYELGLAVAFSFAAVCRPQARNPYLLELEERCRTGLASGREPGGTTSPPGKKTRPSRASRASRQRPLRAQGELRRLAFQHLWTKSNTTSGEPARLAVTPQGISVSSPLMYCAFSVRGDMVCRRVATHGIAANERLALTAGLDRLVCFRTAESGARWLRHHDGLPIGPELFERDSLLVTLGRPLSALAFSSLTGREVWRTIGLKGQARFVAFTADQMLLTTDAGYLYGISLASGQVALRMKAALPFTAPARPWRNDFIALIGRANQCAVFLADPSSGTVRWTREFDARPGLAPEPIGGRCIVSLQEENGVLFVCLDTRGRTLWERRLPWPHALAGIVTLRNSVVVSSRAGAAARLSTDGSVAWTIEPESEETPSPIAPVLRRDVLLVPGSGVRVVNPRDGRIVGTIRADPLLSDLAADDALNVFLLGENDTLAAYRLSTHFAVL